MMQSFTLQEQKKSQNEFYSTVSSFSIFNLIYDVSLQCYRCGVFWCLNFLVWWRPKWIQGGVYSLWFSHDDKFSLFLENRPNFCLENFQIMECLLGNDQGSNWKLNLLELEPAIRFLSLVTQQHIVNNEM